jgi:hypothetical protein
MYAGFFTDTISGAGMVGGPVSSEIEAGSVFTDIKAHRRVKILVGNYPHAVHQLLLLHSRDADLRINIDFYSSTVSQKVELQSVGIFQVPTITQTPNSHEIAKLSLLKCQFLGFAAVEKENYVASFKVNGGFEMETMAEE